MHRMSCLAGTAVMFVVAGCGPTGAERAAIEELTALGASINRGPGGHITSVDLGHVPVGDTQLASLAALTSLESLTLNVTNVTDEGLQRLAPLTKLTSLRLTAPVPREGTRIVFALDVADPSTLTPAAWDRLASGVGARITNRIVDTPRVCATPEHELEVLVASAVPATIDAVVAAARRQGRMEFVLLANEYEHAEIIREAQSADSELLRDGQPVAAWRPVGRGNNGRPKEIGPELGVATRNSESGVVEFLVVYEQGSDRRITSDHFRRATVDTSASGAPCIGFQLDPHGANLLRNLTGAHVPREGTGYKSRLAIVIDGEIHSAPSINDVIADRGIIEGDFRREEVEELVHLLNSDQHEPALRPVPVRIEPFQADPAAPATAVTEAGLARLRQRLPGCQITIEY